MAVEQQSLENRTTEVPAQQQVPPGKKNLLQLMIEWPLSRKISTLLVLLISIALFAVLIIQARTANQQLLYANLPISDASQVAGWLKSQKVVYTLKNNGRDIWVSADMIYQTRLDLAANGMPQGGGVGFEIFDKQSFALTDYVQKVNYTRALQGELARTISSLAPVESTRVHLAIPEKRVFKKQQKNVTASVIVTLVPGQSLGQKQVQGIVHLVAGSVPGLENEYVKVIDSNGMMLERVKKSDDSQMFSADMLAFQQEVEQRMELRVQYLLDRTMGRDNGMVKISATLDFAKVEKTQELFDAEEPVIRSEQVNTESSGGGTTTGGIPGVASNLQGIGLNQTGNASGSSVNSRTTNYEISKTISKIVNPVGTITKLSVSVLVADNVVLDKDGKIESTTPRTPEELLSLKNMVSTAIGLDSERGDMINVISMPFVAPEKTLAVAGEISESNVYQYLPFIKYGLIFFGILLTYFVFLRPLMKSMKGEVTRHYKTVEEMERDRIPEIEEEPEPPPLPVDDAITVLRREVMRNQVPAAFILKNWIQEG
jgi:flagellar M-ring protein FliF